MQPVRREKQVLSSQKTRAPECGYSELSNCFMQKRFKHQWRTPDSGMWSERAPRKEACRARRPGKERAEAPSFFSPCLSPSSSFLSSLILDGNKEDRRAGWRNSHVEAQRSPLVVPQKLGTC